MSAPAATVNSIARAVRTLAHNGNREPKARISDLDEIERELRAQRQHLQTLEPRK